MEQSNQFKITQGTDRVILEIVGYINEDTNFKSLQLGNPNRLEINLNQVRSINSCGIREWIKWLSQYSQSQILLSFVPKIIVDQINMVQGFLPPNGKVISFYVPYYSEESGEEKNVLLTYGKDFDEQNLKLPTDVKDQNGNIMELDVIESKYFKFLNRK
ncbi:MAG: hypothetical protein NZ480_05405 [Bdellovibrionaceae bacterium]|nr:hypothetical protein [Pseudobdellovibrionaceae bacterium]MDW8190457.1 hypothetical protein [Pseudobdellovibrionaceae bacterium]